MAILIRLPVAEQRGYSSVFNALSRIAKEEGIGTLWRVCMCIPCYIIQYSDDCFVAQGCGPTVVRAMVVNAAQLATYSQAKQSLLTTGKW